MEYEIGLPPPRKIGRLHATILIVMIAPVAVGAGFVWRLFKDIGRAFPAAWREAGMEWDAAKRYWRER